MLLLVGIAKIGRGMPPPPDSVALAGTVRNTQQQGRQSSVKARYEIFVSPMAQVRAMGPGQPAADALVRLALPRLRAQQDHVQVLGSKKNASQSIGFLSDSHCVCMQLNRNFPHRYGSKRNLQVRRIP